MFQFFNKNEDIVETWFTLNKIIFGGFSEKSGKEMQKEVDRLRNTCEHEAFINRIHKETSNIMDWGQLQKALEDTEVTRYFEREPGSLSPLATGGNPLPHLQLSTWRTGMKP